MDLRKHGRPCSYAWKHLFSHIEGHHAWVAVLRLLLWLLSFDSAGVGVEAYSRKAEAPGREDKELLGGDQPQAGVWSQTWSCD